MSSDEGAMHAKARHPYAVRSEWQRKDHAARRHQEGLHIYTCAFSTMIKWLKQDCRMGKLKVKIH